jgi:hypothetical protein
MADYEPVDLSPFCNVGTADLAPERQPPTGEQLFHGLPFRIGDPASPDAQSFIRIMPGERVTIPLDRVADRVIIAHRRLPASKDQHSEDEYVPPGRLVAEYGFNLTTTDEPPATIPIRERLEIGERSDGWDPSAPFLAPSTAEFGLPDRYEGRWDLAGWRQCELDVRRLPDYFLWTWQNPRPEAAIGTIELAAVTAPILVAAITLGNAAEHPFVREAARTVRFTALGPEGPRPLAEPAVEVDRGIATYAYRLPGTEDVTCFAADPMKGWGEAADPDSSHAYSRVGAIGSATVVLKDGEHEVGSFTWRDLTHDRPVERPGLRVEVAEQGRNWVHVSVLDDATGRPVPCRVAFRSPAGVPYQPHG